MNVAKLELCKELYDLSSWKSSHHFHQDGGVYECNNKPDANIPAYDLGYLLRNLPREVNKAELYLQIMGLQWASGYVFDNGSYDPPSYERGNFADTPEDAVALLAIELFKQKILTKEPK